MGKLDSHMNKNKTTTPLSDTIHKDQFITDLRLEWKTWNHKTLEENISNTFFDNGFKNNFLDISTQARESRAKINKWDYTKIKSFA